MNIPCSVCGELIYIPAKYRRAKWARHAECKFPTEDTGAQSARWRRWSAFSFFNQSKDHPIRDGC